MTCTGSVPISSSLFRYLHRWRMCLYQNCLRNRYFIFRPPPSLSLPHNLSLTLFHSITLTLTISLYLTHSYTISLSLSLRQLERLSAEIQQREPAFHDLSMEVLLLLISAIMFIIVNHSDCHNHYYNEYDYRLYFILLIILIIITTSYIIHNT